jgi:hypothetical protein
MKWLEHSLLTLKTTKARKSRWKDKIKFSLKRNRMEKNMDWINPAYDGENWRGGGVLLSTVMNIRVPKYFVKFCDCL